MDGGIKVGSAPNGPRVARELQAGNYRSVIFIRYFSITHDQAYTCVPHWRVFVRDQCIRLSWSFFVVLFGYFFVPSLSQGLGRDDNFHWLIIASIVHIYLVVTMRRSVVSVWHDFSWNSYIRRCFSSLAIASELNERSR